MFWGWEREKGEMQKSMRNYKGSRKNELQCVEIL